MRTHQPHWQTMTFSRFARLAKGMSYKSEDYCEKDDGHPFVTLKCISKGGGFSRRGIKFVRTSIPQKFRLKKGDLVIANTDLTRDGDVVGSPAVMPDFFGTTDVGMSMDLSRVDMTTAEVDKRFISYALATPRIRKFMQDNSSGSTVLHLKTSNIGALEFHMPPDKHEQSKIADILSTVDRAVELGKAVIMKRERIKNGLMQDLLTRGIDDEGNIRGEKTHKFKESLLGRIPEEWNVGNLRTFGNRSRPYLKTGPFGSSLKGEHWVGEGEGIPVVTIGALGEEEILRKELMYISRAKAKSLAAYALRAGDLMFSRVADVGRSIVIDEQQDGWIMSSNFMRIALDDRAAVPRFLHLNFKYNDAVLHQVRRFANAGGRSLVNSKILNSLVIPWPHRGEQERIVNHFAVMNQEIRNERDWLRKLQRLKHGLMEDLLTGEVRVNLLIQQ
jgi:type I restriction enzyme S subunit